MSLELRDRIARYPTTRDASVAYLIPSHLADSINVPNESSKELSMQNERSPVNSAQTVASSVQAASNSPVSSSVFPSNDRGRKSVPIFTGAVMYFPKALAAVADVSRIGNDQHNPGKPLHWNRTTSMDQFNTAQRHLIDHGCGYRFDSDGARHLAKAAWRILAALELDIEQGDSFLPIIGAPPA